MDSSDKKLEATVKQEDDRLIVTIMGFVQASTDPTGSDSTELPTGGLTYNEHPERPSPLEQLEEDLAHKKERLKATQELLKQLELKEDRFGLTNLPAHEAAELERTRKKANKLKNEILDLKAKIRDRRKRSSDDSHPYSV